MRFQGRRIRALAKAHDLLAASNWAGADLRDIALAELAPYRERGEPMLLSLGAALMLGMVFHEPATNAAKHGAFTTAAGYVDVAWKKDGRRVIIEWRERDGPKAERPKQDGFGLKLIERGIAHELQGHATVHSSGDGHPARRRAGRAAAPPSRTGGASEDVRMLARLGWHRGPGAISDPWSKSRVAHRLTGSARSTGDLRRTVKTLVDESRRRMRKTLQRLQRQRHKA